MVGRKMKTGKGSWQKNEWQKNGEGKVNGRADSIPSHRMGEGIGFEIPGNFVTFCKIQLLKTFCKEFVHPPQLLLRRTGVHPWFRSPCSIFLPIIFLPSARPHFFATHFFANKSAFFIFLPHNSSFTSARRALR